jgi:hypothetical protein
VRWVLESSFSFFSFPLSFIKVDSRLYSCSLYFLLLCPINLLYSRWNPRKTVKRKGEKESQRERLPSVFWSSFLAAGQVIVLKKKKWKLERETRFFCCKTVTETEGKIYWFPVRTKMERENFCCSLRDFFHCKRKGIKPTVWLWKRWRGREIVSETWRGPVPL